MSDSIGQILVQAAATHGAKTALVIDNQSFTYQQLDAISNQVANGLLAAGVEPGDRVSLYGANAWEWVVSYFGVLKTGAVVNPINVMLTPGEVEFVVQDCGAKAIISSVEKGTALLGLEDRTSLNALILYGNDVPEQATSFHELIKGQDESFSIPEIPAEQLSTICYTSGTTGKPKGAMLSHEAVLTNVKMTALMHGRNENDVVVTALPCPHVYGNVVMSGCFNTGGTLVLHSMFDPDQMLASLQEHRATIFDGVPTMYMYLLEAAGLKDADLSSLRMVAVGGQTMPTAIMEAVEREFGCPLIELWGMTELAGLGTTFAWNGAYAHGSIGVTLPYVQAKLLSTDDPAKDAAPGEVGELAIKGPIVMQGYFGNEAGTKETLSEDGWLRTGDVATINEKGYITIVDRIKDMILTAGFNVYPAELENVIAGYPDVAMVAVGPIPDDVKGELAKAYIVPKKNTDPSPEKILAYCREHLAAYKVPREIQFVDDFPKTSSGKIMRRELITLHNANLKNNN